MQLVLIGERLQREINAGKKTEEAFEFAVNNMPESLISSLVNYFETKNVKITNENMNSSLCSRLFDLSPEALKNAKSRELLTGLDLAASQFKFQSKLAEIGFSS